MGPLTAPGCRWLQPLFQPRLIIIFPRPRTQGHLGSAGGGRHSSGPFPLFALRGGSLQSTVSREWPSF